METSSTANFPPPLPAPASATAPAVAGISSSDRTLAALCHVSFLIGLSLFGVGFVVPLVILLIKRDESPFVAMHAREVLNFQISVLLYLICCIPLVLVIIGIPLMLVVGIAAFICPIIGAVRAADGSHYLYPVTIRFI